jgi:hypothetical protein
VCNQNLSIPYLYTNRFHRFLFFILDQVVKFFLYSSFIS